MTAAAEELDLDAQDVKTQDTSDSDSDSGQGSCEMSFRSQISKEVASVDEGDSDEEICTHKKIKCRRVLADSNSEGEDDVPENLKVATSNVESTKEKYNWLAVKGNKNSLSYKAGVNSDDDSDAENQVPQVQLGNPERKDKSLNRKEMKEKSSSRKRKRKEEKRKKTTRQARKKEKAQEPKENGEDFPFNDSGCLLTDKELFDNGLEEEEEEENSSFQVENLEMSINSAEKVKTKKQKLFLESEDYKHVMDESEGPLLKESRKKKLKPARLTKDENRQLHSESQRLVREAAVTLPYHLPEAKSVQEFFKHKPRPSFQGSAMALLKSMKTQPNLLKEDSIAGNSSISCHTNGKEQLLQPGILDPPISDFANPLTASLSSSSAEETEYLIGDCSEKDKQNDDSKTKFREYLNSRKEGELNEVPVESKLLKEKLEGNIVEGKEAQSLQLPVVPQEPIQDLEPLVEVPSDKMKKSRLDRLRELGVDLSIKPKLCYGMESFIDLDEPKSNRELEALKERFVKHAFHTVKPKTERMVSLNIIRKEIMNDGKEELKADVVPVILATEVVEDSARTKPGEKLQMLKAKLQVAMKLRRTEERQKRHALFKLDNEDVMEEEEEEEEEMSDELEEEEEEDEAANQEDPNLLGEMEEEHEDLREHGLEDDKETDKESADEDEAAIVGLPCSVVSKPLSTESTLLLFKDNSSKIGCFLAGEKVELEETLSKRAEKQDDEDSFLLPTLTKENSHNSSFELVGSMIPSYQPCNKQMGRGGNFFSAIGTARSPSPSPGFFKTSFISSASKSSGKVSEPSLPIEDSQDLYNVTPEEKSPVPTGGRFQFQFSLEDDTQSQLLDADGFLNVGHHRNKYQSCKTRLPLASMDENAMDANMGELLDLYSGLNQHSPNAGSGKKSDMEELLNLCSGKFPSQDSPHQVSSATSNLKKKRRTQDPGAEPLSLFSNSFPTDREVEDEEKEEFEEFQLLTDDHPFDSEEENEKSKEEQEEEEESDQEEGGGDELEFDDEEEDLKRREGRKNKFNLQDFMEDEAELSGSEGGSEDEYDGEELNEYEEDVLDEVLPADGELHDQVNKIHMKMMLDDDKRQLRLYQERYLLDGDLHNDGPGRMRKFRWKNIDDIPEGDAFHRDADSGDENENHLEETEAKWRKERFEREQWFREQSMKGEEEKEEEDVEEDSQFMRLAKKVTSKSLQKKAPSAVAVQKMKSLPRNPFESFQPGRKPQLTNGSLLNQPRAVLQKLAAMSDLNPNAPRNSRNFVFQTLSPVKSEDVREKAKPQVKRKTLPPVAAPSPKRLRLNNVSVQETRSIFQYLER